MYFLGNTPVCIKKPISQQMLDFIKNELTLNIKIYRKNSQRFAVSESSLVTLTQLVFPSNGFSGFSIQFSIVQTFSKTYCIALVLQRKRKNIKK